MPYTQLEPISKQVTIVVGLTVVGFMAFGLALSFYRNILFEETLADLRTQNEELKQRIVDGQFDLEYYRSAQYKDKYAKENLGLINPGEKVIIITQKPKNQYITLDDDEGLSLQQEAAFLELLRQMPTVDHWMLYLFHPEQIEELKQADLIE